MKAFKAYDIRGVYNRDFKADDVYKIGFFLPALLEADAILVGRDVRKSTEEIFSALCKGVTDAGADVVSIGLTTTPMVYFCTAHYGFDASVQITASHNPPEYNGLKISKTGALPVGYDTGLQKLEQMMETEQIKLAARKGSVREIEAHDTYINFLRAYVPDISALNIAIDCSNGMAAVLIKEVLGTSPFYMYDTLDGTFPNHDPNPLDEKNLVDLQQEVIKRKCQCGVIFDGDADRVMFIDEKGHFVPPDLIIGLLGRYFLAKEKGNVLMDIRTSKAVSEYITSLGGTPHIWKVGHAFAKLKMKEIKAVFGGELAGHYYFRDFFNCDSGILAALLVLQEVKELHEAGSSLSEFIDSIKIYANSGEINLKIEDKQGAMEALKETFTSREKPQALYDFDGYRIEYEDWWFNVRPSNTEPYLRLVVEGKTDAILQKRLQEIDSILKPFADKS